jgi:hypothetical protein
VCPVASGDDSALNLSKQLNGMQTGGQCRAAEELTEEVEERAKKNDLRRTWLRLKR